MLVAKVQHYSFEQFHLLCSKILPIIPNVTHGLMLMALQTAV